MRILLIFLCLSFALTQLQAQDSLSAQVYFDATKWQLDQDAQQTLSQTLGQLKKPYKHYQIQLIGHTDNVGSRKYNQNLSEQRCESVQNYFLEQGFASTQLKTIGHNFSKPAADNSTPEGKAQNRRVEIICIYQAPVRINETLKIPKELEEPVVPLELSSTEIRFDAEKDFEYTYPRSGTRIFIPANSLMDNYGEPVKGEVVLSYREFRDAADFILGNIPMNFDDTYHFNSAGMFEISAKQDGKEVAVKDGQTIQIDFMMTEELDSVGFFKYGDDTHWRALGMLDRENRYGRFFTRNNSELTGCEGLTEYDWASYIKRPFLRPQFRHTMKRGQELADLNDVHIGEYYTYSTMYFDDRRKPENQGQYIGMEYKKMLKPRQVRRLQNIKVNIVEELADGFVVELKPRLNSHPELSVYSEYTWIVSKTISPEQLTKNKTDIAVEYDASSRQHHLTFYDVVSLEQGSKTTKVLARINFPKELVAHHHTSLELIYKYQLALDRQRKHFNNQVDRELRSWEKLYNFSAFFMKDPEACYSQDEWYGFFEENKPDMVTRYDSLTDMRRIRQLSKAWEERLKELDNYALPSIYPVETPPLVQRLDIDGFGIFNCDQLRRLDAPQRVITQYKDEKGRKLNVDVVSLVDYRINSVLTFPAKELAFSTKARTALVVFTKDGRRYLLDADKFGKLALEGKKKFTFEVKDISQAVKSPQDLRMALNL